MKAVKITFEISNITLKQGFIFLTYENMTFDKAYKAVVKEMKIYDYLIENVKCEY